MLDPLQRLIDNLNNHLEKQSQKIYAASTICSTDEAMIGKERLVLVDTEAMREIADLGDVTDPSTVTVPKAQWDNLKAIEIWWLDFKERYPTFARTYEQACHIDPSLTSSQKERT